MATQSRMICRVGTDEVVIEVMPSQLHKLEYLDRDKFYDISSQDYLARLNRNIKESAVPIDPESDRVVDGLVNDVIGIYKSRRLTRGAQEQCDEEEHF